MYGVLANGRQVQCDMQTAHVVKSCYVALSDVLTGAQMVEHFERYFIPAVASDMTGTHTFASSAMSHISHSAWMLPSDAAISVVGTSSSSQGPAESKPSDPPKDKAKSEDQSAAKVAKVNAHWEKIVKDMKQARERDAAQFRAHFDRRPPRNSDRDDRLGRFNDREQNERPSGDRAPRK